MAKKLKVKKQVKRSPPFAVFPMADLLEQGEKVCVIGACVFFKQGTLEPKFVMVEVRENRRVHKYFFKPVEK